MTEQEKTSLRIAEILTSFKIGFESIEAKAGPATTLYEVKPRLGVKISRIRNLQDELSVGLETDNIRIFAPIPGKGTVGIEVPNKERIILPVEQLLSSQEYEKTEMELPLMMGMTAANNLLMTDLTDMPHLLIAGATGQGKSVCLNTLLMSLINKKTPEQLKIVLIDPKQVEFRPYDSLYGSYLAKHVITEAADALSALTDVISLMEARYIKLSYSGARNLREYNEKYPLSAEPYVVVVMDEFGDLIMQAGKQMEEMICRIAQKARAVGIHLILATQRPSVSIVTGDIKANFPTRIAFRVTTATDSRVVLGKKGAETLTGKGDMLLFNERGTVRAQCAFTSKAFIEETISRIMAEYKSYEGKPFFESDILLEKQRQEELELQRIEDLKAKRIEKFYEAVTEEFNWYDSTKIHDTIPLTQKEKILALAVSEHEYITSEFIFQVFDRSYDRCMQLKNKFFNMGLMEYKDPAVSYDGRYRVLLDKETLKEKFERLDSIMNAPLESFASDGEGKDAGIPELVPDNSEMQDDDILSQYAS